MNGYIDILDLDFDDTYPILAAQKASHPLRYRRWVEAQRRHRAFADRSIRPIAVEDDRRSREDHDRLDWEFCKQAAEEGLFSVMIPPMFGGQGGDIFELAIMLEELCAACTGLANIVGAHYLGYSGMAAGMNLELMGRISREIVDGEKRGEPVIMSAAHTEPAAGSDVEDEEMMPQARVGTTAVRKDGGWVVNGQKVFISDGHLATYHMVSAYRDRRDPLRSGLGLLVKTGDPGFSMVKHERKMGQRACPASSLLFEDCFVPDSMVITEREVFFERIIFVLGTSRVGVAAIATGCARGALDQAARLARTERSKGRFLIEHQWVQQVLADMMANVMIGRALWISAAFGERDHGMMSLMSNPVMNLAQQLTPGFIFKSAIARKVLGSKIMSAIMNKTLSAIELRRRQRVQAHSSAAKWVASDLAMQNAVLAMEIAGPAGLEQKSGVEKFFRDAKLLQIYEGTNQINRKHLFDSIIARATTL